LTGQHSCRQPAKVIVVNHQTYKRDWGMSVGDIRCAFVFLNPEVRPLLEDQLVAANMYRWFGG
ncbi:MAG: hypothetical protein WCK07_23425, partial [Betaproteobacteria bacterium]